MSAPGVSTWDLTVPYRAGDDDFNDFALEDDGDDPPGDPTLPSAALFNTLSSLLGGICAVIPNLVLGVTGGNPPAFGQFTSMVKSVRENPASSTFTMTRLSAGVITITWPAGTFPASVAPPTACLNDQLATGNPYSIGCESIANGVGITTKIGNVTADLSFTVTVY